MATSISPARAIRVNRELSDRFVRIADLLEAQEAESFRVAAYRAAARTLTKLPYPVTGLLVERGRGALEVLPTIGRSIAALIEEFARTGRIGLLERLEGHVSPEDVLTRVPGIGEVLATRIHEQLGIETLEELELAAHDGSLSRVEGFGARRVEAIRAVLAGMLTRRADRRPAATMPHGDVPSVSTLLAVDRTYRRRAERGQLRRIAPHRFNPRGDAWLPILHDTRHGWSFTALYSNTARAHRLGTTRDWVVIYYERDGDEGQCTVVTERRGDLAGWRVVRGREDECREWYTEAHGWAEGVG